MTILHQEISKPLLLDNKDYDLHFANGHRRHGGSICSGKSRISVSLGIRTGFLISCYIDRLHYFFVALFILLRILFGLCHFVYWDLALLDLKITLSYKTRTIKDDEFLENIPGPLSMTQLKLLQLWLYLIHHSCVTDEAKGLKQVEKNCLKSHDQIAAKWKVEPTVNPVSSHQITLS